MRTPPTTTYSGLTIILDEPSRFDLDTGHLLSHPAGDWMDRECFAGSRYSVANSDIRTCDNTDNLLDNTKAVILMGAKAAAKFGASCDPPGYLGIAMGKPALPVFYAQDCCDYKNMRRTPEEKTSDEKTITDRETKEKSPTDRENYRFWTKWHIRKFIKSLEVSRSELGTSESIQPIYYPNLNEVIHLLSLTTNSTLYLDIETSRRHRTLSCIGFATQESFPKVYVVPVYLYNGQLAYAKFYEFYKSLSLALSRNTVVIHNAMFDLTVLCGFFHMCYPKSVYDTMAAHHRCFLEAEKSLAHAISAWTWEPNHKDCNTEVFSQADEHNLWKYNAKDVYVLKLIKDAQFDYIIRSSYSEGIAASVDQVNKSIIPFLDTSLTGLGINMLKLANTSAVLERHKTLYAKVASILVGSTFNPGSSKQCAAYFHTKLGYETVEKSTKTGEASLGAKQLYQLQLKYPNPLIPVILKYRTAAKDASMLETELLQLP
jgi:hypothetical protein